MQEFFSLSEGLKNDSEEKVKNSERLVAVLSKEHKLNILPMCMINCKTLERQIMYNKKPPIVMTEC